MLLTPDTDPQVAQLLQRLLTLATSSFPLPCVCLRAVQTHQLKRFEADGATFSFPLHGTFRYRENGEWVSVQPGQMLVVPNARSLDIEYAPCPVNGEFLAISVTLFEEQLEAARLLLAAPPSQEVGQIAAVEMAGLIAPLTRWNQAMLAGQRPLSLHAMVEVVLMLSARGVQGLLRSRDPSLAMKIRRMIGQSPDRPWLAAELEQELGMSGATLRRRLAAEATNLRTVIADARMAGALSMLMTSELPVKTVAARVGYHSVTSFSKTFADRYGLEPSCFRRAN